MALCDVTAEDLADVRVLARGELGLEESQARLGHVRVALGVVTFLEDLSQGEPEDVVVHEGHQFKTVSWGKPPAR